MDEKRVLVTGGAGFIGSHLTDKLVATGWRVGVFDNFTTGKLSFLLQSDALEIYRGDLKDPQAVQKAILSFQPQVVFHLAALHYIPYCNGHPDETIAVNVDGTYTLLESCQLSNVQKIIFASTAAVYAITNKANHEESPLNPTDIYGQSKLQGEQLVQAFHENTGIPISIARFFNVYGTRETNPHVIPSILEQLHRGNTYLELGNMEPKRDYIHVEDVVQALVLLERHTEQGCQVYNVGTGTEHSVYDLVDAFSTTLGHPLEVRQSSERIRPSDRLHLLADISKITAATGWQHRYTFLEGLRQLLQEEQPLLLA
jgi:UDP-glucose 4-epimerase